MSALPGTREATAVATDRAYLREVFSWMFLGLALTTGVAVYLHNTSSAINGVGRNEPPDPPDELAPDPWCPEPPA